MTGRVVFVTFLGMLGIGLAMQCPKQKTSPGREVVCYTSVSDSQKLTDSICRCTTLVHQGHDVRNLSTSDFENFRKALKEINPTMQFLVSVDDPEKTLRTSATVRQESAARMLQVLKEVDGVQLNVTAGSKERLFQFVKNLKDEMVRKSYDKRLFLVLPTKAEALAKQFDLKELSKYVDLFTVPSHHLVDDDEAYHTFHPSRLMGLFDMVNTDSLIDLISGLGAPKGKILVSVPASAYRFVLKDENENAPRSPTNEKDPVVIDRKELCELMNKGEWTIERDEDLTAPYAFRNKTWIAFEDSISVGIKGKYAILRDLPGLAIYNIENDFKTKCGKPLTHEVHHSFTDFKRKSRGAVLSALEDDLHQAEITYPNTIKSSDFRIVRVVDTEGHIRVVRENTQTEFTCVRQGYFVHPKSCNRFYRCVKFNQEVDDYSVFEFDCPAGLVFDESTEVCVWPGSLSQESACPGSSEIAPVTRVRFQCPSVPGYYADPQNARWFFACMDLGGPELMAYEFRCPYGLVFDEHKLVCEWPWLVFGNTNTEYSKAEYDHRGHTAGSSTQGVGGYITGGLPQGFSVPSNVYIQNAAGGHVGSTAGLDGYTTQYSGFHGASGHATKPISSDRANVGYSGSIGSQGNSFKHGYSGSINTGTVNNHAGSDTSISSGLASGEYSGSSNHGPAESTGRTYTGGSQYTGSTQDVYSGFTNGDYYASSGHGYSEASGTKVIGSGDSTSNNNVYLGSSDTSAHAGSITGSHATLAGADYSGASNTVYTGGVIGGSAGSAGLDYTGTAGSEHLKTSLNGHSSVGAGYSGVPVDGLTTNSHADSSRTSYLGASGQGYFGRTEYSGSASGRHTGSEYFGSTSATRAGSFAGDYSHAGVTSSSTAPNYFTENSPTRGYAGAVAAGNIQHEYSGSSQASTASGTKTGFSSTGYSRPSQGAGSFGHTLAFDTTSSNVPIYSSSDLTEASNLGASGVSNTAQQISAVTVGGHGQNLPTIIHLPNTYSDNRYPHVVTASSAGGQSFIGNDHDDAQGIIAGSASPNQLKISTTYHGNTGGDDGYIANDVSLSSGRDGIPSGTSIYHGAGRTYGNYDGSKESNLNITLVGTGVSPIGSTTYQGLPTGEYAIGTGSAGAIVTGNILQGSVITDGSSSGSLFTHGDASGAVFTSPSNEGTVLTSSNYPGYTKTGTDIPGYVISEGVKTIYADSTGPKTVVHGFGTSGVSLAGSSAPSTVVAGESRPGTALIGQGRPSTSLGGSFQAGTLLGSTENQYFTDTSSTIYHGSLGAGRTDSTTFLTAAKTGSVPAIDNTGYKTNEYHDNGGRGTIKFNNGYVTSKYTENDIPDYRPAGGSIPDSIAPGGSVQGSAGAITYTTVSGIAGQTPSYPPTQSGLLASNGFTKTGPTRTGITTATLGGRGSYVIGTRKPRPIVDPEQIGAKAFEGSVTGYTKASAESSNSDRSYSSTLSTQSQDTSHIDSSKITLGPSVSTGYSYPKPSIPFQTGGLTSTSPSPTSPTDGNIATVTTPSPFLNVEVYNNPTIVDSAPITAAPAVVNTYTYNRPSKGQYPEIVGKVPTGLDNQGSPTPSSTPLAYVTEPSKNYKTTAFEAVRIPVAISTVQSVIDNYGNKVEPAVLSAHAQSDIGTSTSFEQSVYGDRTNHISVTTASGTATVSPGYTPTKSRRPSVSNIPVPTVAYQPSTVTVQPENNYAYSTTPAPSGYSYGTPKTSFDEYLISSDAAGTSKPQTHYLPTDSSSAAIGGTYTKLFTAPGITYKQSTVKPQSSRTYGFIGTSRGSSSSSAYSDLDYSSETKATIGSSSRTGSSPTNLDISRDEVGKLITNYDRGTIRYTPSEYDVRTGTDLAPITASISSTDSSQKQAFSTSYSKQPCTSSTSIPFGNTQPSFDVATYPSGYSKPSTVTASYEVTTKPTPQGRGKVIVKWSDLHPLLLGKLGAECTCRADPFANLRGPGKKLIASSRGEVDLSNYDESEVYVDLEKDGSYEDGNYVTNYEPSSLESVKLIDGQVPAVLSSDAKSSTSSPQYGRPSSSYLPRIPSTLAPISSTTPFVSAGSYDLRGSTAGFVEGGNVPGNSYISPNRDYTSGHRSGKNLDNAEPTANSNRKQEAAFDRYGPGGLRDNDETLEGVTDCARPGLFRHPNFCNKFYVCHWDEWKKKFTLHVFNCPVHLTFDNAAGACNWPSKGPACQDDNLLV